MCFNPGTGASEIACAFCLSFGTEEGMANDQLEDLGYQITFGYICYLALLPADVTLIIEGLHEFVIWSRVPQIDSVPLKWNSFPAILHLFVCL
uniref:Uncharacterized protein n=1 Tax=Physcomitrium patens TaxID=3218 RepID=A0A2K1LAC4_PHYPA|nr:hypothetical protein PHYPA_001402 [Physcomitrium patens]